VTITITRRLEIDMGHRLMGHESKCRHPHGHRYAFMVTVSAKELDKVGLVIDFGVIKSELGGWLDEHWDHAFMYQNGDPIGDFLDVHDHRRFMVTVPPTAENIAEIFLNVARDLMHPHGIEVEKVVCWETPNSFAEAS